MTARPPDSVVRCATCRRRVSLYFQDCLINGWPKCHDQTMTLVQVPRDRVIREAVDRCAETLRRIIAKRLGCLIAVLALTAGCRPQDRRERSEDSAKAPWCQTCRQQEEDDRSMDALAGKTAADVDRKAGLTHSHAN